MMKKVCCLFVTLALTACNTNTLEGSNMDLKKGGDQIRKSGEQIGKALKTT